MPILPTHLFASLTEHKAQLSHSCSLTSTSFIFSLRLAWTSLLRLIWCSVIQRAWCSEIVILLWIYMIIIMNCTTRVYKQDYPTRGYLVRYSPRERKTKILKNIILSSACHVKDMPENPCSI